MNDEAPSLRAHQTLFFTTLGFTICFAAWMLNGVLATFLAEQRVFNWGPVELGWLMGIPVLAGSIFRLPAGVLCDRYGGKYVCVAVLFLSAVPMFLLSYARGFAAFAFLSFGFGLAGNFFATGIAFTSYWYPKRWQGRALGIFGAGNAGAAVTTLLAPTALARLTRDMTDLEGWRTLPRLYAAALLAMGLAFLLFTENRKPADAPGSIRGLLAPLLEVRVWRFGLYYFLVFGCFVAFSQWLVPYFLNVYALTLVTAGICTSLFSLPSGVIRAIGGWLSDHYGARKVMYWVLGSSVVCAALLSVPRMRVYTPGKGVNAKLGGTVTSVGADHVAVDAVRYSLAPKGDSSDADPPDADVVVWPRKSVWQEPLVTEGDKIKRRQLLARGTTRIFFQANVWIYTGLVLIIGTVWGIGKAAVYKYIPEYFPREVGSVGGMVGLLGGLGGFVCPILFGYVLEWTGLWTSCWMMMLALSVACLAWLHAAVTGVMNQAAPHAAGQMEYRKGE
ncbi:MAG: NarK/NasA family nitrate transporter [Elusimicrobia bacterium]|nr:NarK/NasA family nitrate transporter [Elusimicrobiota bacterium]